LTLPIVGFREASECALQSRGSREMFHRLAR
jgi:hypothetical protein